MNNNTDDHFFSFLLEWNGIMIATVMQKALSDNEFKTKDGYDLNDGQIILGFDNDGKSAFIVTGYKSKSSIVITIENEEKQIHFRAGIVQEYLPKGKKIPQFNKKFKINELVEASKYFEMLLETVGTSNENNIPK